MDSEQAYTKDGDLKKFWSMSPAQLLEKTSIYRSDSADIHTDVEKENVFEIMYEKALKDSFFVHRLFDAVRYDSPDSVRDLYSIISLYRRARREFVELSHTRGLNEMEIAHGHAAAEILNRFVEVANGFHQGSFYEQVNYLFARCAQDFAQELLFTEMAEHDPDDVLPFEITRGRYAVFAEDRDRVYVAGEEDAGTIERVIKENPITFHEQGQYFARHTVSNVSPEIEEMFFGIMDSGESLSSLMEREGIDVSQLPEYIAMLKHSVRNVLERDFGVSIKQLTLREQFYLLQFIKSVTVEQAESVQMFCKTYGINGLRTFLTNSYDPNMSERIFTFAALTDEEVVKDICASYTQTLDAAENMKRLIDTTLADDTLAPLSREIFESFVRRSAHLFYAAEKMADYSYDYQTALQGETVEDLKAGFGGIALLSRILADAQEQRSFLFTVDTKRTQQGTYAYTVTNKNNNEIYGLKISTRPHTHEVVRTNKETGEKYTQREQARINIELSLDTLPIDHPLRKVFYNKTEFTKQRKSVESSVIRFGFDLDDAHDPHTMSFDMGRNAYHDDVQVRTGDVLGRILDRVGPEGHHITESFSPQFSDPETFAKIVALLQQQLTPQAQ